MDCDPGELFCLDWVEPMSTAIVRIYTHDGFVVAADGRKMNGLTGAVAGDNEQKVFQVSHPSGSMCCAFAGNVQLTHKGTERVGFDYRVETLRTAEALASIRAKSLFHYTSVLAAELIRSVRTFETNPYTGDDSTHIFIDGFFAGHPKRTKITIHGQDFDALEVSVQDLYLGKVLGYGSQPIMDVLFGKTEKGQLSSYREKCRTATNLSEAIDVALNVVRAHADPVALLIDPHTCAAIGGHIHVGTVTPQTGFGWAVEPTS